MLSTLFRPEIPEGTVLVDRGFPEPFSHLYTINQVGHIRGRFWNGHNSHVERQYPKPLAIIQDKGGWFFRTKHLVIKAFNVADLVLLVHGPPRPSPKHKARFIDGDKDNHVLWNLEWMTLDEMIKRGLAIDFRLKRRGPSRIHTREQYEFISRLRQGGLTMREICELHYEDVRTPTLYARYLKMKQLYGGK